MPELISVRRVEWGIIKKSTMESETTMDVKSLSPDELTDFVTGLGEKPFRAKQMYQWMHEKTVTSFDEMHNLPAKFRETVKEQAVLTVLTIETVQISRLDGTRKYLFRLADGNMVESVFMKYKHGNSVCISSQAGCRMGCSFCASAIGGLVRNLTASEMLEQVYRIGADTGERISNVVVMGTGEPLDNYENLLKFIRILTGEGGQNLSRRSVTVSTCGLVPGIRKLADENLQITLALSLHASTQEKREKLMPAARMYALDEVFAACDYYFEKTGRRVTYEYSLIAGVNDSSQDAQELAALLAGRNCHLNLIPVNPVKERGYRRPDGSTVRDFQNKLDKHGINVTIRREMGRDIDGACGQLRRRYAASQTDSGENSGGSR